MRNQKTGMWRVTVVLWAAIGNVACVCAAVGEEPWLAYSAAKTDKSPVVDGRLNDPCWQGIERTRPMTCLGGAAAPVATTGLLCWDDKNLYIGLICLEPKMAVIRQRIQDRQLVAFAESVEIFLDAEHYHFNFLQCRVDITGKRSTFQGVDRSDAINRRWIGEVAQDEGQWTVEVAIPWDLLGNTCPDKKTIYGLNLNRNRTMESASGDYGGCTCWSDTKGPFQMPNRFGHLVFFPYATFLRSYFAADFLAAYDEIEQLNRTIKNDAGIDKALSAIRTENQRYLNSLDSARMVRGRDAAIPYAQGAELQRKLAAFEEDVLFATIRSMPPLNRNPAGQRRPGAESRESGDLR